MWDVVSDKIKLFEDALEELLDEETFNDTCTNFMFLCNEGRELNRLRAKEPCKDGIKQAKLELFSRMVPALTIFNEVDEYPEWFDERDRADCQRRLMRLRKTTESDSYNLVNGIGNNYPQNYIYYRGEVYIKE